jgi:hypothetical protein
LNTLAEKLSSTNPKQNAGYAANSRNLVESSDSLVSFLEALYTVGKPFFAASLHICRDKFHQLLELSTQYNEQQNGYNVLLSQDTIGINLSRYALIQNLK